MKFVKPEVYLIAKTELQPLAIIKWLTGIGVSEEDADSILDELQTGTPASGLISLSGKRCYKSFNTELNSNISRIRTNHKEHVRNLISSGHGSVLEHASWTFAIENVSRVFTGEMNRHRAGVAVSEGSMRFIRGDQNIVLVPSLFDESDEKCIATLAAIEKSFEEAKAIDADLTQIWQLDSIKDFSTKKKLSSLFRRIVGMGVATGGVWTINARALRHIIEMRTSAAAEEELQYVFDKIATIMKTEEPLLFEDFEKNENGEWISKYRKV